MINSILFIQTGGTIDKDYPRSTGGYAFEITTPAVERMLECITPVFSYRVLPLLQKDSQEITDEDRDRILKRCQAASERVIIITHGTDTMLETAEYIAQRPYWTNISDINLGFQEGKKLIILTGAMKPERFVDSDAMCNLGLALGAASLLESGVYIAMSGHVLLWSNCQ